jgi:hypothetical protein
LEKQFGGNQTFIIGRDQVVENFLAGTASVTTELGIVLIMKASIPFRNVAVVDLAARMS